MKKAILTLSFSIIFSTLYAQSSDAESIIRALEQKELQAVLTKDTATLRTLWSEQLTVNAPVNRVVQGGKNTLDRPVVTQLNYTSFVRNIEHVLVNGNVAITMGNEVVVEKGTDETPGRTINRRYTNIWQKEDNAWKMVARHANQICASQ